MFHIIIVKYFQRRDTCFQWRPSAAAFSPAFQFLIWNNLLAFSFFLKNCKVKITDFTLLTHKKLVFFLQGSLNVPLILYTSHKVPPSSVITLKIIKSEGCKSRAYPNPLCFPYHLGCHPVVDEQCLDQSVALSSCSSAFLPAMMIMN